MAVPSPSAIRVTGLRRAGCVLTLASLLGALPAPGAPQPGADPLSPQRLAKISARYLRKPYALDCLGEGHGVDRDPLYDARRVDCQTLVEQVMADALSERLGSREAAVRAVRYRQSTVSLANRFHYCLPDWLENAWPARDVTPSLPGVKLVTTRRRIDLPSLLKSRGEDPRLSSTPARDVAFRYLPRASVSKVLTALPDGSIAVFVSSRKDLMAAHLGFLFRTGEGVVLRHASQTRRRVIDEPLTAYLARAPKSSIGLVVLQPTVERL